jgi:hypothetical protein
MKLSQNNRALVARRFGLSCVLLSAIPLAACHTTTLAERERIVHDTDAKKCASYGFSNGTTEFSECLQKEALARQAAYRMCLRSSSYTLCD